MSTTSYDDDGFVLWEALMACAMLAIILPSVMSVTMAVAQAERRIEWHQAARQHALSMAEQLAAGRQLLGRVPLPASMLSKAVACLGNAPPVHLLSIRWQREDTSPLPNCSGSWPSERELCLQAGGCK